MMTLAAAGDLPLLLPHHLGVGYSLITFVVHIFAQVRLYFPAMLKIAWWFLDRIPVIIVKNEEKE